MGKPGSSEARQVLAKHDDSSRSSANSSSSGSELCYRKRQLHQPHRRSSSSSGTGTGTSRNGGMTANGAKSGSLSPAKRLKLDASVESSPAIANAGDFVLTGELVIGAILTDLTQRHWRVGKPIGKGSFGEIFLASDNCDQPVSSANAAYVVKIEPHSNGPLFVEIHCLMNAGKPLPAPASAAVEPALPPGMPAYIASGSHCFAGVRYRFLILRRYECDLSALIERRQLDDRTLLCVAVQIIDVLEHLHDRGYAHSDIKAENLMLGSCAHRTAHNVSVDRLRRVGRELRKWLTKAASLGNATGSTRPSDDAADDTASDEDAAGASVRPKTVDAAPRPKRGRKPGKAPVRRTSGASSAAAPAVPFSGSNPVRSCRGTAAPASSTYQDMLSSHYLRPVRKINYGLADEDSDEVQSAATTPRSDGLVDGTPLFDRNGRRLAGAAYESAIRRRRAMAAGQEEFQPTRYARRKLFRHADEQPPAEASPPRAAPPLPPVVVEDRIHLIDFGLAIKFVDSTGQHRPFCMDDRRAHDGTLEFTSRDAHMGAHSRRSDLECFAYNLLYWTQGWLPWKEDVRTMQQPEQVHRMKEIFMTDVRVMFQHVYGRTVPRYLLQFMRYVASLSYHDRPDYDLCRNMFRAELRRMGVDVTDAAAMRLSTAELRARPAGTPLSRTAAMLRDLHANSAVNGGGTENRGPPSLPAFLTPLAALQKLMSPAVLPFREIVGSGPNRMSPKNLRSKTDKKPMLGAGAKDGHAKRVPGAFSWTDILSTDPDEIARQRAEKEYDRDHNDAPLCHRYTGKPTYAILQIQHRMRCRENGQATGDEMPVGRLNAHLLATSIGQPSATDRERTVSSSTTASSTDAKQNVDPPTALPAAYDPLSPARLRMRGLRTAVRPTPKSLAYRNSMLNKLKMLEQKRKARDEGDGEVAAGRPSKQSRLATAEAAVPQAAVRRKRMHSLMTAASPASSEFDDSEDDSDADDDDDDDDDNSFDGVEEDVDEEQEDEEDSDEQEEDGQSAEDDDDDADDSTDGDEAEPCSPVKTRRRLQGASQAPSKSLMAGRPACPMAVLQRKAAIRAQRQMAAAANRRYKGSIVEEDEGFH